MNSRSIIMSCRGSSFDPKLIGFRSGQDRTVIGIEPFRQDDKRLQGVCIHAERAVVPDTGAKRDHRSLWNAENLDLVIRDMVSRTGRRDVDIRIAVERQHGLCTGVMVFIGVDHARTPMIKPVLPCRSSFSIVFPSCVINILQM